MADIRPLAGRGSRKQQGVTGIGSDPLSSANGGAASNGSPADSADVTAAGRGAAETDVDLCQRLTVEAGVTLIPVSKHELHCFNENCTATTPRTAQTSQRLPAGFDTDTDTDKVLSVDNTLSWTI